MDIESGTLVVPDSYSMRRRFVKTIVAGAVVWDIVTDRVLEIVGNALTAISNGIDRHKL